MNCINKNCENETSENYYTCVPCTPQKLPFTPQEKFVFVMVIPIASIFFYLIYKLHDHPFFWPVVGVSMLVSLCTAMMAGHGSLDV